MLTERQIRKANTRHHWDKATRRFRRIWCRIRGHKWKLGGCMRCAKSLKGLP